MAGSRSNNHWEPALQVGGGFVLLLTAIKLLEYFRHISLARYGILPRTPAGLAGILFSPLLHGSFAHLAANSMPLLILLTLLYADHHYRPGRTLAMIWLASGFGTWLIGRGHSVHIGASSLIFGLVAYLAAAGLWVRSWRSVLVAVVVLAVFGGIFWGVLPQAGPVSWEGHLSGAAAGFWAARKNRR
jgi:membrane associated rhomboid family serine protease